MRFHIVLRYIGLVLLLNSFFMTISCILSLFNSDSAFLPLLYSALITALFGIFPLIFVPPAVNVTNKEGLFIVVSGWFLSCLFGVLPYILWGEVFTFTDAWFESVSGFTTTGSTILINIESLPSGLLFWRAATHWIGGIGIIIFVLSVLPFMGMAEVVLFRSEISAMARDNFNQRAKTAIKILVGVYIGLTFFETILLLLAGMNLFDAITHSFATIATGGFSPKNSSIAHYDNVAIEIVVILFMILSGIHFVLLFSVITGNIGQFWKSTVVRYYLIALLLGTIITTIFIHGNQFQSWADAMRYASFQVISVGTSTGFATADSSRWPAITQLILIFFTLQCACAGSTSGGIKVDRVVILAKALIQHLKQIMHPNAVIPVRLDQNIVRDDIVCESILFIAIYLVVIFVATVLLTALGVDILSAFTGTVATIGNVGPGFGTVGSIGNFSQIPVPGKWLFTITMLLGRLEIYAFFIFFTPGQWRKTSTY